LVDAPDSKSGGAKAPCRFEPDLRYHVTIVDCTENTCRGATARRPGAIFCGNGFSDSGPGTTGLTIQAVGVAEGGSTSMGRRGRRRGPGGRAEGRVRGRIREGTRGRTGRQQGGSGSRRGSGSFDVGDLEDVANRLGGSSGSRSGLSGAASAFPGAASGLAGAASGLAGGSLAQRFLGGGSEGSEEEFRKEVLEQLALLDERLRRLEDQMQTPGEGGNEGEYAEGREDPETEINR
jgi:hypothetical protein